MKILIKVLIGLGLLLLLIAGIGRLSGNPSVVMGLKVINLILIANTVILLGILVKLFEKKQA